MSLLSHRSDAPQRREHQVSQVRTPGRSDPLGHFFGVWPELPDLRSHFQYQLPRGPEAGRHLGHDLAKVLAGDGVRDGVAAQPCGEFAGVEVPQVDANRIAEPTA